MSCLVAIQNARRVTVGAGVLVAPDLVLTCAHVVNVALGRSIHEPTRPRPEAVLFVAFAAAPHEKRGAGVADGDIAWSAPPAGSAGDICLLRLQGYAPAAATPARLRTLPLRLDKSFRARASGFPEGWNQRPNAVAVDYAFVDVV